MTSHKTMPIISADFENNNTALSNSIITSENIQDMDVVINTGLVPLELFKENDALNSSPIIIRVPSDNDLFQILTDQTPAMYYILPDMDNYLLPATELILEKSINSDREYNEDIFKNSEDVGNEDLEIVYDEDND